MPSSLRLTQSCKSVANSLGWLQGSAIDMVPLPPRGDVLFIWRDHLLTCISKESEHLTCIWSLRHVGRCTQW